MTSVVTVVLTTPTREREGLKLGLQLRDQGLKIGFHTDKTHNGVNGHNSAWRQGYVMGIVRGADWVCVCEDDIILCPEFSLKFQAVLDAEETNPPVSVISLYSNYQADVEELRAGRRFRVQPAGKYRNEQWLCMRTSVVAAYLSFFSGLDLSKYESGWHDVILSEFFQQQGLNVLLALPNLVDHRQDLKSELGHGGRNRRSRTFGMEVPNDCE